MTKFSRREEPSPPDRKENIMSDLIAVAYNDKFKAEKVRLDLLQMQQEQLVDADPGKILEELKRYDGKVLQASLTHENEAMLTSAIETDRHKTSTRR
jgi:uncharacterized membrane protein